MAEDRIRGQLRHSRHSHQFRATDGWTKMWDPNKQQQRERNDNRDQEKEPGAYEEREEETGKKFELWPDAQQMKVCECDACFVEGLCVRCVLYGVGEWGN